MKRFRNHVYTLTFFHPYKWNMLKIWPTIFETSCIVTTFYASHGEKKSCRDILIFISFWRKLQKKSRLSFFALNQACIKEN